MHVIGTAGHVDHGKSTLIAALTGTHPDRLKEEQEREMTIDLGFAWLTLPDGEPVGIVDVPGHRDFIENMLAGVGGIDAVLFVIAADEGVMPQTREHLAILDLLQVQGGVVALTKTDLAPDAEWLDLIEGEVRRALLGTVLETAPLVRVSARNRTGLDDLLHALADCLAHTRSRPDLGRPRLPIDRAFSIAGFGTVVTGTLLDGRFKVGDEIEVLPKGVRGRIRGLQTHKQKEEIALPGSRTAVNVSGVDLREIQRGNVLAHPGQYHATQRLDVHFRLLEDASASLTHSAEVKLFLGAAEVVARVRLLGSDQLQPGEQGWLQLELRAPVVAVRGDRYILRRPSPGETLGGGIVVEPQPRERHKRFDTAVLQGLEALRQGTPAEVLLQAALALEIAPLGQVIQRSRLVKEQAEQAVAELLQNEQIRLLEGGLPTTDSDSLVVPLDRWRRETMRLLGELDGFHSAFPLRHGMPREELKSRLKMNARVFSAFLRQWIRDGQIVEQGALLARANFQVKFSAKQEEQIASLIRRFAQSPNSPPSVKDSQAEVGEDVLNVLLERGDLVLVSEDVLFRIVDFNRIEQTLIAHLESHKTITVAEFRDLFRTSRKYALAVLEYLDKQRVTVRDGDYRRLNSQTKFSDNG